MSFGKFGFGFSGGVTGEACGNLNAIQVVQTLTAGDNTVNHALGATYVVTNVTVLSSADSHIEIENWDIIDSDNLNINLPAGTITSAKIEIQYRKV